VARDILAGQAVPMPDATERDAYGLPVVIWAPAEPKGAPAIGDIDFGGEAVLSDASALSRGQEP
jgi:hypothetical protein